MPSERESTKEMNRTDLPEQRPQRKRRGGNSRSHSIRNDKGKDAPKVRSSQQQTTTEVSHESGYDSAELSPQHLKIKAGQSHPSAFATGKDKSNASVPIKNSLSASNATGNHFLTSTGVATQDASLTRLWKDLRRCDASLVKYEAMLFKNCELRQKQLQDVFAMVHNALNTREDTLACQLNAAKQELAGVLQGRRDTLIDLQAKFGSVHTLNETELESLKEHIKNFIMERKVDEEVSTHLDLQVDHAAILSSVMSFGTVVSLAPSYTLWKQRELKIEPEPSDKSIPTCPATEKQKRISFQLFSGHEEAHKGTQNSREPSSVAVSVNTSVPSIDPAATTTGHLYEKPVACTVEKQPQTGEGKIVTNAGAAICKDMSCSFEENSHEETKPDLQMKSGTPLQNTNIPKDPPSKSGQSRRKHKDSKHAPSKDSLPENNNIPSRKLSLKDAPSKVAPLKTSSSRAASKAGLSQPTSSGVPADTSIAAPGHCNKRYSAEQLSVMQSRVRSSLEQLGVYLYDPISGNGPCIPKSSVNEAGVSVGKKKTPTQLRRERKRRQIARERLAGLQGKAHETNGPKGMRKRDDSMRMTGEGIGQNVQPSLAAGTALDDNLEVLKAQKKSAEGEGGVCDERTKNRGDDDAAAIENGKDVVVATESERDQGVEHIKNNAMEPERDEGVDTDNSDSQDQVDFSLDIHRPQNHFKRSDHSNNTGDCLDIKEEHSVPTTDSTEHPVPSTDSTEHPIPSTNATEEHPTLSTELTELDASSTKESQQEFRSPQLSIDDPLTVNRAEEVDPLKVERTKEVDLAQQDRTTEHEITKQTALLGPTTVSQTTTVGEITNVLDHCPEVQDETRASIPDDNQTVQCTNLTLIPDHSSEVQNISPPDASNICLCDAPLPQGSKELPPTSDQERETTGSDMNSGHQTCTSQAIEGSSMDTSNSIHVEGQTVPHT